MVKTRKTRAHSYQSLEKLRQTAEPDFYGFVCWYLANRDTQRHCPGDMISLDVPDATGAPGKRQFRLTGQSFENISRCLGMRTAEETSRIFLQPTDEEPRGECARGHPEAAFDYIMSGIVPTKPCPECGQMAQFEGSIMSPNFGSNEPVKVVNGRDYRTCPDCDDEILELHGTDPHGR